MNHTVRSKPALPAFSASYPLLFVGLWSTGFIGAKYGLPDVEPLTFLTLRYAAVIVLMGAAALVFRAPPPQGRLCKHIAVSGLLVHGVYLGGVFIAISRGLPAGITALVVGLQPLVTALAARALSSERIGPSQWTGLLLGFLGVALVVGQKATTTGGDRLLSMLLPAVVALLGITAGTLYQKHFCPSFDFRTGAVIQFVACLLLSAASDVLSVTLHVLLTVNVIFALRWLVLVLSLGAVGLLNVLIRRGSAVHVASLFYLTPAATALIAWALFDESLSGIALVGIAVTAAGVWMVRSRR